MDCFGRVRTGYSIENCQTLNVDTNIVYKIEEQRFPGLGEDDCEFSLRICPEYLAIQRPTQGAQPLTAHPGSENQPLDKVQRELYNLIDDLDFLSDGLSPVFDQSVGALLEMTTAGEDELTTWPISCQSHDELANDPSHSDDVFLCGTTDYNNMATPLTVFFSDCWTSKHRAMSISYQEQRTSRCSTDVTSKVQKKRRYYSVSQERNDVTYSCVKRRKLNGNVHNRTELSDFTASSTLLPPRDVLSQSYSGHSPLRPTSLRQW